MSSKDSSFNRVNSKNKLVNGTYTWLDARNECRKRCMELVSLETDDENNLVADYILKSKK